MVKELAKNLLWEKPKAGIKSSLNVVFIITLIAHGIDAATGFQRGTGYFWKAFAGWFLVWFFTNWAISGTRDMLNKDNMVLTGILSFGSFALPLFAAELTKVLPQGWTIIITGIIFFAPLWPMYLLLFTERTGLISFVGTLWFIFWIVLSIYYVYDNDLLSSVEQQGVYFDVYGPVMGIWDFTKEASLNIWEGAKELKTYYNKTSIDMFYYATAQDVYYAATVDENTEVKLGVYLEDLQMSQDEFYYDEPVSVWGTIVANTFDKDIYIGLSCVADRDVVDGYPIEADKLVPASMYEVSVNDETDLDCYFERKRFDPGQHYVNLLVNFTFQTMAYQKTYFVDKERATALARNDVDILDHYGITEKDPKTVYTNGPVMIGMGITGIPIKVTNGKDVIFTLGMSLKNQWDGKVLNVTGLKLMMPSFMELESTTCGGGYEFSDEGDGAYSLTSTLGEFDTYKTIRCQIKIPGGDVDSLLGDTPIGIHFFKVTADYDYQFDKTINFKVMETDEMKLIAQQTVRNEPVLTIEDQQMDQNDKIAIDLTQLGSDTETRDEFLRYHLKEQSNISVVQCEVNQYDVLVCTSWDKDGFSDITVTINDLYYEIAKTIKVYVGISPEEEQQTTTTTGTGETGDTTSPSQTAVSCAELGQYIVYCDGSSYKALNKNGECVSLCEYYKGCYGIGEAWSCGCTLEECNLLMDKSGTCLKGYCPGSMYCCILSEI